MVYALGVSKSDIEGPGQGPLESGSTGRHGSRVLSTSGLPAARAMLGCILQAGGAVRTVVECVCCCRGVDLWAQV